MAGPGRPRKNQDEDVKDDDLLNQPEPQVSDSEEDEIGEPGATEVTNEAARALAEAISPTVSQDDPDKPFDESHPDTSESETAVAKILAAEDRIAQDKTARGEFPMSPGLENVSDDEPAPSDNGFFNMKDTSDPHSAMESALERATQMMAEQAAIIRDFQNKQALINRVANGVDRDREQVVSAPSSEQAIGVVAARGTHQGNTTIPTGPNGRRVNQAILNHFSMPFEIGQKVRHNPQAVPWGAEESTENSYAENLTETGLENVGTVRQLLFLGRNGEWKYLVHFPGENRGEPTGYYGYELVPA